MSDAENQKGDLPGPTNDPLVRWRAWPCASCRGATTPLSFLVSCFGSIPQVSHRDRFCQIDWQKKWQADRLLEWINRCPHTQWVDLRLRELATGSEHLVVFDEVTSEVVKVTLPGTYGEYYEIIDDRINQFSSTPEEYLLRMHWWEELFSTAPAPLGMTESGQIVSRQKFIVGDPDPPQGKVDQFLVEAGAIAVKQRYWLWKKVEAEAGIEIWIGDARSDNFVLADGEIIPIDIRIWGVPIAAKNIQE
ncbi:MAG TPA: hypothetical protein VGM64_19305 [Lacunisphaera sp.]|jgi:hypothetical protein